VTFPSFIAVCLGLGMLLGFVLDGVGQVWGMFVDLVDSL